MVFFDAVKKNTKLFIIMGIIIVLGTVGITVAITMNEFNAVAIDTASSIIDANITYDEGTNTAEVINNGNMLPISDSLVNIDVTDPRVLKVKFNVSGVDSNPENTIYDVVLRDIQIDCELRTTDLKWRLYKNNALLSEGNLSPTFDTMNNDRLVLTNTQEDLTSTEDKYTFLLWISELCDGDITQCDSSMDQSIYLNKILRGSIKIELSTKGKKEIERITGEEGSCYFREVEVPVCNNLIYNGNNQNLVNTNDKYTLINNTGVNAGNYNVTLDLEDEYKWNDGSTDNKVISCDIDKYDVEISTLDQNIKYKEELSNNSNYINISSLIEGHNLSSYQLVSSIYDVGVGTISVNNPLITDSLGNDVTRNYNIKYNEGNVTINCLNVAKMPNISDFRYTGEEQTGITGGEYVDINGDKNGTDIGTYTVNVKPWSNYCWGDNTTDEKQIEWKIITDVIIINLDNQGADTIGSTSIYTKNNIVSLNEDISEAMTTDNNNIEVPSKIGYTFKGYYTEENGNGVLMIDNNGYATDNLLNGEYNDDITLYANWKVNTYTINFYENTDYIADADTLIVTLSGRSFYKKYDEPSLVAYAYNGTSTGPVLVGTTPESVSFYQSYNSDVTGEEGTFEYNGTTYYYSLGGYWMVGSYNNTSETNIKRIYLESDTITKDVAMQLLEENNSSVSQKFVYGISQNLTANTYTRKGYTFVGWSTNPTGDVVYTDGANVNNLATEDAEIINLYAIWKDNTSPELSIGNVTSLPNIIDIPITVNKDVGSGISSTTCQYKTSSGSYSSTNVTVSNSACRIIELDPNTSYDYKVCSYDRVGNESCLTGSKSTTEVAIARINDDANVTHYSYYNYSNYGFASDNQTIWVSTNSNQAFLRTVSAGVSGVKGHKIYGFTMTNKVDSNALRPMIYIFSAGDLSQWPSGGTTSCNATDSTTPAGTWARLGCVVDAGYDYISVIQFAQASGSASGTIYFSWLFLFDLTDYFGAGNEPSQAWCNKWINDSAITVSYDANGGSGAPNSQVKTKDVNLTLSSTIPSKNGYVFNGWKDTNGNTHYPGGTYTSNSSTTMTAQWVPETYSVCFEGNNGTGVPGCVTKTYGETLTLPSTKPTRYGYGFLGWSLSSTATSATWSAGDAYTINSGNTLYAVWQPITSNILAWRASSGSYLSSGEVANEWISYRFYPGISISTETVDSMVSYIQYCVDTTNTCTPNTTYTGDKYISSNSYIRYRAVGTDGSVENTNSFYGLVSEPVKTVVTINCTSDNYNSRTTTACSSAGYSGYAGSNTCAMDQMYSGTRYTCTAYSKYKCYCNRNGMTLSMSGATNAKTCGTLCLNSGYTMDTGSGYTYTYDWDTENTASFDTLGSYYCTVGDGMIAYDSCNESNVGKYYRDCTENGYEYSGTISCYE